MNRTALAAVTLALLTLYGTTLAGDPSPTLMAASGTVVKVEKNSLTLQPRDEAGKFGKNLVLKLTGTSKLTVLTQRKQGKKMVAVQNEVPVKELKPGQQLAVIFTAGPKGAVLLSGVALPPLGK
jgi:hypothetical protein